jgi:hypothetical protein
MSKYEQLRRDPPTPIVDEANAASNSFLIRKKFNESFPVRGLWKHRSIRREDPPQPWINVAKSKSDLYRSLDQKLG